MTKEGQIATVGAFSAIFEKPVSGNLFLTSTFMKHKWPACIPLLILLSAPARSQEDLLTTKLRAVNNDRDRAIRSKDPARIASFYTAGSVCMPEFHPAIEGVASIQEYFSNWTKDIRSNTYTSHTTDLVKTKTAIIETGTFTDTIVKISGDTFLYPCKYMRHWLIDPTGELRIGSEIWGATEYIDRSLFPYTGQPGAMPVPRQENVYTNLHILKRNSLITRLVKERKGTEHARLFTNDALYMPYYMPVMSGIDQVTAYFTDHEKPGDVTIDSLTITSGRMFSLDNMILEHGFYRVRWIGNDKSQGVVTGKSLNLWKRNEQGEWMLHRQMVNHN